MKKSRLAVIAVAVAGLLAIASSASAATEAGNDCTGDVFVGEGRMVVATSAAPGAALPGTIPSAGVITEWTVKEAVRDGSGPPSGGSEAALAGALKIVRPHGKGGTVVGESAVAQFTGPTTSSPTRIPVQEGDLLADVVTATQENGKSTPGGFVCSDAGRKQSRVLTVTGSTTVGTEVTFEGDPEEVGIPIVVKIEPDADNDGYGDETQDQCPTDPSTQGPCPSTTVMQPPASSSPPPPPQSAPAKSPATLGATRARGKGAVNVYVTASRTTKVTVSGSVRVRKHKTIAVDAVSKRVKAGAKERFKIVLPAKVKVRLHHLPPSRKLTVTLSVTAPGAANSVPLTMKLAGKAKGGKAKGSK